jgi:regulatory protein
MAVSKIQNTKCYATAMRMLVRREHSRLEMEQKLQLKGYEDLIIADTITLLNEQNYQSNKRFADDFIQMRFNQGKGPIKIGHELRQRGIDTCDLTNFDWLSLAKEVNQKKVEKITPNDYKSTSKQKTFLQSRGFDIEQINHVFH